MGVIRFKRIRRLTARQRWKEAVLINATTNGVELPFPRRRDYPGWSVSTPHLKLVIAANT